MDNVACFVGLDYHQKSVQVCVLDAAGRQRLNRSCPNDWRKIVEAVAPLGPVGRVAVEACGGPRIRRTWRRNWSIGRAGASSWRTRATSSG